LQNPGDDNATPLASAEENRGLEMINVPQTHATPRKYLELTQDVIVFGLCVMLFVSMAIKLFHLGQSMLQGTDFSLVVGDVLFILVLVELFRLLLIYLEEHRVSVATMVEVGIVSTLREVILRGALHIEWQQLLVLCAFILTLGTVLRLSGIRSLPIPKADIERVEGKAVPDRPAPIAYE
jgi:uncharacterized membrane protein (DUF373 family)